MSGIGFCHHQYGFTRGGSSLKCSPELSRLPGGHSQVVLARLQEHGRIVHFGFDVLLGRVGQDGVKLFSYGGGSELGDVISAVREALMTQGIVHAH